MNTNESFNNSVTSTEKVFFFITHYLSPEYYVVASLRDSSYSLQMYMMITRIQAQAMNWLECTLCLYGGKGNLIDTKKNYSLLYHLLKHHVPCGGEKDIMCQSSHYKQPRSFEFLIYFTMT